MNAPHNKLRVPLYRLRGTKIGKNVFIGPGCFLEESRPDLITIEDNVSLAPHVKVITHDSSYHGIEPRIPIIRGRVIIKRGAFVGTGSIILPGVTIGERSIIGAGSVVTKDIPPNSIAVGIPARVIKKVDEEIENILKKMEEHNVKKDKKV